MIRTTDLLADAIRVATGPVDFGRLQLAQRQLLEMEQWARRKGSPNFVQATLMHADGSVDVIGVSENVRTNDGADWMAGAMGGLLGSSTGSPATATSATSLTSTGTALTTNALKGRRIRTGADVYGNVVSNTTSVVTVDQWWTAADGVASTPGSTAPYTIEPGYAPARFLGITTDAAAAAAGDTALTSEITTNGGARALGTYAHTASATTYTLSKTFAFTGTFTAIHKGGIFTALTGGLMVFETVLNADANVINGDSMALTWTVTNA